MFSIAESVAGVAPAPTPLIRDLRTALERAQRAFERGHMRETIDLLEHALTLDPDHVPARTMLGLAYARTRLSSGRKLIDLHLARRDRCVAEDCRLLDDNVGHAVVMAELILSGELTKEAVEIRIPR